MRTLKFRAWDKERKNWQYFTLMELITGQGSIIYPKLDHWCEFTGLRDRNGKEIYEGDVVYATENKRRYVVHFGEYNVYTGIDDDPQWGWCIKEIGSPYDEQESFGQANIYLEVCGNIYEHPELLEVKK